MELHFYKMMFSILLPIVFGILATFSLAIGLRGVLTKQPFLISNKWWFWMIVVMFIPGILLFFLLLLFPSNFNSTNATNWLSPLISGAVALIGMWYQRKNYVAYAATETSFHEALLASIQRLQLPYEEILSGKTFVKYIEIRLTSVEATLKVSIQPWMGLGFIKVKQDAHRSMLRKIVNAMNEYFRTASVPTSIVFCIFCVVMGGFMVIGTIGIPLFYYLIITLHGL